MDDQQTTTNPASTVTVVASESRVDELKRELAAEYQRIVDAETAKLSDLDAKIARLNDSRKEIAQAARQARTELERLTGERTSKPDSGNFECGHPGCDRSFSTKQGVAMHKSRVHKPDPRRRDRPTPPDSTRSVYRCGEPDTRDGDPCGSELRSLADLSHHGGTTPDERLHIRRRRTA